MLEREMTISLPNDIEFNVLARLPVKSLIRFKSVSKPWHYLISDPSFIDTHLECSIKKNESGLIISYIEDNRCSTIFFFSLDQHGATTLKYSTQVALGTYHVLPSCNGLVCFYGPNCIHICNPNTQKLVMLPEMGSLLWCCGFGYNHLTKDYEVIKVSGTLEFLKFEIFSLGTGSWKMIRDKPGFRLLNRDPPIFVNGFFYWLAAGPAGSVLMVSFDIENEKFGVISHPECLSHKNRYLLSLVQLNGLLCLVDLDFELEEKRRMDVWMLLNTDNWVCESIVHPHEPLDATRPVMIRDGQILLYGFIKGLGNLSCYDLKSKGFKKARIDGIPSSYFFISSHVESLVVPSRNS